MESKDSPAMQLLQHNWPVPADGFWKPLVPGAFKKSGKDLHSGRW